MKETNSTSSSKETNDPVNSPSHYNMLNIEAINLIEMSMTEDDFLGYLKGNALKYIIRYKHKGNPEQDISKAIWYLEKLKGKIKHGK
tara:strand:- start:687 stop:947 length:261 start_codon:yes stop_codon:yes gene_type:complete